MYVIRVGCVILLQVWGILWSRNPAKRPLPPPSFLSSPLADSCDIAEMTLGARSSGGGGCLHFFGLHVGTLRILHLLPLCVHPDDFP